MHVGYVSELIGGLKSTDVKAIHKVSWDARVAWLLLSTPSNAALQSAPLHGLAGSPEGAMNHAATCSHRGCQSSCHINHVAAGLQVLSIRWLPHSGTIVHAGIWKVDWRTSKKLKKNAWYVCVCSICVP